MRPRNNTSDEGSSTMNSTGASHLADSCPEMRSSAFSRRSLIKGAIAGAVAAPLVGLADASVSYATQTGWTGDVLVVMSLRGGFDGLSAIVPWHDPAYYTLRPNIAVPDSTLIKRSDDTMFGLHPAMAPLQDLYLGGQFGAVVAAGLPAPNRSHFDATDEVEEAIPGSPARTGWLDRLLGLHPLTPLSAVQMGSSNMPTSYLGPQPAVGMNSLNGFKLAGTGNATDRANWAMALNSLHSRATAPVKAAATDTLGALGIVATAAATAGGLGYPGNSSTANALRDVARLIKNNASLSLGVKVVTLDVGNWDMHVGLGTSDSGWMHNNLTDLAGSLAAFAADLGPLLSSTTLVTVSEFGRRVQENDSGGVDHGWGNQMLLLGGHITPGVQGKWAGLDHLTDGDVSVTTDYRSVFADILKNRLNTVNSDVALVFPPSEFNLPYARSPYPNGAAAFDPEVAIVPPFTTTG
jgi:uncharacterized protein (DUF1501 family)